MPYAICELHTPIAHTVRPTRNWCAEDAGLEPDDPRIKEVNIVLVEGDC